MAHSSLQSPSLSLHDTKGRLSLSKHLIKASEEHQVPFLYCCKTQHGEVVHSSRWVLYSKAIPDFYCDVGPTVSVFSWSNCSWWYSLRSKKILLSDLFELGWYQNQTLEPTVNTKYFVIIQIKWIQSYEFCRKNIFDPEGFFLPILFFFWVCLI